MNSLLVGLYAGAVGCVWAFQCPATAIAESTEMVLHSFGGGTDGAGPHAGVIDVSGTLYGTTGNGGGSKACGDEGLRYGV